MRRRVRYSQTKWREGTNNCKLLSYINYYLSLISSYAVLILLNNKRFIKRYSHGQVLRVSSEQGHGQLWIQCSSESLEYTGFDCYTEVVLPCTQFSCCSLMSLLSPWKVECVSFATLEAERYSGGQLIYKENKWF